MSTITKTCIESQFNESSKFLKLKVSAQNRDESNNQLKIINNISANTEYGGKSFLQYLTNMSSSSPKEVLDKENVYIHTLSKSASSRLSEKSLQICTENLGCETGSFLMFDSSNILSLSSNSSRKEHEGKEISEKKMEGSYSNSYSMKKVRSFSAFPPPLTTMCGEKALQIRCVREGGRLISKAVEIPSQESCFVADRSDGRLRLRLFNDFETNVDDDVQVSPPVHQVTPPEEDEDEDEENETLLNEESQNNGVNDGNGNDDDDDDDDEKCNKLVMSKEVVNYDVEVENNMGKEKFRRFVRCKECNKGLSNWEPMWVATS